MNRILFGSLKPTSFRMQTNTGTSKKYVEGMFTVEAAFLIPFVTFLVLLICYLDLHLFSRTYAEITFDEIELQTLINRRELQCDPCEEAEKYCESSVRFLSCVEEYKHKFVYGNKELTAEYSFDTVPVIGEFAIKILGEDRFHEENKVSLVMLDPIDIIRTYRMLHRNTEEEKDDIS